MNRLVRRSGGLAVIVALALLMLVSGGPPGVLPGAHPSATGEPPTRLDVAPRPLAGYPNQTLAITNGSLIDQALLTGNGRNPFAGVYDPHNGNTYFADADAGSSPTANVTVVSGPSRSVIATDAVGTGPLSAAGLGVDPDEGDVFVANSGFASVSVINGTTERVQATVTVGLGPEAIAYDPLLDDMIVANTESSSISFLNVSTDRVDRTVDVGALPTALAFDPVDSDLWVANSGSNSVSVVSAVSASVLATEPLPGPPGAIAADLVSGDVYVANPSGGNVSVLNGSNFALTHEIGVGPDPNAVIFDGQDADFYVPSGNSTQLFIIDPRTHTAPFHVTMPSVVASAVFDAFNGEVYLTESGPGGVTVLRGTGSTPYAEIATGRGTRGISADPSDGWVFVGDYNASALLVVNGTSERLVAILPTAASPGGVAYDALSGDWFASDPQQYSGEVLEINGLTNQLLATIPVGSDPQGIVADPANGTVVVADAGSNELSFVSPNQGRVVWASYLPDSPSQIALDPSNQALFVTNPLNASVTEVNGTNGAVLQTVPVGQDPSSLGFDPIADAMVVANTGSGNLTLLDARTGLVTGSIALNGSPVSVAYDPSVGELFVTVSREIGPGPNFLVALGGGSLSLVRTLVANPSLGALTYDPIQGVLYMAEPGESRLVAVDGSTDQVEGSLKTPGSPGAVAFGGSLSELCIAEASAGALSFFIPANPAEFPVRFEQSGLPGGAAWSVDLDGQLNRSFASSVAFELPNGTDYPFSVGVVLGYRAIPAAGTLNVSGVVVLESVRFVQNSSFVSAPSGGFLGLSGYGSVWALGFLAVCVAAVALLLVRRYAPGVWGPVERLRRYLPSRRWLRRSPPVPAGGSRSAASGEGQNTNGEDRDAAGRA